jgi:hypothetical protein
MSACEIYENFCRFKQKCKEGTQPCTNLNMLENILRNRHLFTYADFVAADAKINMQIQLLKKVLTSAGPGRIILHLPSPAKDIKERNKERKKHTNIRHDTTSTEVITGPSLSGTRPEKDP